MNKRHKHAELIKLWADGAEIELLSTTGEWLPTANPTWGIDREYRVKPQPLLTDEQIAAVKLVFPEAKWVAMDNDGLAFATETDNPEPLHDCWTPFWSRWNIPGLDGYADSVGWKNSPVDLRICSQY